MTAVDRTSSSCRGAGRRRGVAAAVLLSFAALSGAQGSDAPAPAAKATSGVVASAAGQAPMTLKDAFLHARQNDAVFRAAGFEYDAIREAVPIARASLLPTVGLNASTAEVEGWRKQRNQLGQDIRTRLDYVSPQASLQMRMPLFNREALVRLDQTQAQVDAAESSYAGRGIDLVDRLLVAYMTLLLVEEAVEQNRQQLVALEQQAVQARGRLERGEGTRVDVVRTQAEVDVSRATGLDLDLQLRTARRELQRITGAEVNRVRGVPANLPMSVLAPEQLFTWLEMAERLNPTIRQRQQLLAAARLDVQRNRAGHLPRVDLVASLSQSQNESISNIGQTSTLKSLGVQLSVPIFSGGAVEASVRQSLSEQARAEEDLRLQRETVALEVQRQHQALTSGLERLQAQAQAVASAELSVEGTQRSFAAGFGTSTDVADALARRATARRELAQIRIELLLARARLLLQAGTPLAEAVDDIDRLMAAELPPGTAGTPNRVPEAAPISRN